MMRQMSLLLMTAKHTCNKNNIMITWFNILLSLLQRFVQVFVAFLKYLQKIPLKLIHGLLSSFVKIE